MPGTRLRVLLSRTNALYGLGLRHLIRKHFFGPRAGLSVDSARSEMGEEGRKDPQVDLDHINRSVLDTAYAVRGEIVLKANEMEQKLKVRVHTCACLSSL